ncbi:MAG: hypothetical protein R2843_08670 [Thermomicrobiales bacterium]
MTSITRTRSGSAKRCCCVRVNQTIRGTITKVDVHRGPKVVRFEAHLDDGTGWIRLVRFNGQYIARQIGPGDEIVVSGEIEAGYGRSRLWLSSGSGPPPPVSTGGLIPVYPLTKGLFQKMPAGSRDARIALDAIRTTLTDYLLQELLAEKRMPAIHEAYESIHYPKSRARSTGPRSARRSAKCVCSRSDLPAAARSAKKHRRLSVPRLDRRHRPF